MKYDTCTSLEYLYNYSVFALLELDVKWIT